MNLKLYQSSKQGITLIAVLAIIVLMAILGAVFLSVSSRESKSAISHTLNTRAKMLANSGIEEAVSRAVPTTSTRLYLGEDWNKNYCACQDLNQNNKDEEWNGNNNGVFEYNVHPKYALHPTYFFDGTGNSKPDLIPVQEGGRTTYRAFSGKLPASSDGNDTYTLKIRDNNAKLNMNSLNPNMEKMINVLYQELPDSESGKNPGTKIMSNRPELQYDPDSKQITGGYRRVKQLLDRGILTKKTFRKLQPFITVHKHTWLDRNVIAPQPQPGNETAGTVENPVNPDTAFDYDFQYDVQPRAPVNINRAPEPILTAVLTDLQARVMTVNPVRNSAPSSGRAPHKTKKTQAISQSTAGEVAEKIVQYRIGNKRISFRAGTKTGPFETWPEFEAFVRQELFDDTDGDGSGNDNGNQVLTREQSYVLMANFNPNTRFSKFNPDKNGRWSWRENDQMFFIDKTDLLYHTTEFSFFGGGMFTIQSYGRVTGPEDRILAESSLKVVVQKYSVLKHSSQRDFMVNRVPAETNKIASYPEQIHNVGLQRIKTGRNSGSNLGGKLSIAPVSIQHGHHNWNFKEQDEVTDSRKNSAKDYMSDSVPFGHQFRDFTDVSDHHPDDNYNRNHGVLSGKRAESDGDYPVTDDPFAYSDVVPDGALIGSDRNRSIRFPVRRHTDQGIFNWKRGHVEFWWKPKQPIALRDQSDKVNVKNQKQYVTGGERITLFNQWILARNAKIQTTRYNNAQYHWNKSKKTWWLETFGGERTDPTVPKFPTYKVPEDYARYGDIVRGVNGVLPEAAGYYMSLWIQDNTWYFLIRFRSFFHPKFDSTWSGSPYKNQLSGSKNLLGGAVLLELPMDRNNETKPVPGHWTHVVLNWKVKTIEDLKYVNNEGAEENAIVNDQRAKTIEIDKSMLSGDFWINNEKANEKTIWAEGNIVGNQIMMSNFGTAMRNGKRSIGFVPAGWPPTWYKSGEFLPTMVGPKRIDRYQSVGHLGGRIRKRGPKTSGGPNFSVDKNYRDWWVSFAEGTIDEAYISNDPENAKSGGGIASQRYNTTGGGPHHPTYVGKGHRGDASKWNPTPASDQNKKAKYSGYARNQQKVFRGKEEDRIQIKALAHTQYRPREDRKGNTIPEGIRPNYRFAFKSENGSYQEAPFDWTGAPESPEELLNNQLKLGSGDSFLQYRARAQNATRPSNRLTPYLEDVIILYKNLDQPNINYLSSSME